jgi:hypothetical protein
MRGAMAGLSGEDFVMKRLVVAGLAGALLAVAPFVALAQDTKTVKGTVTAVAGDSLTVKVADKDMTFKVDAKTRTIAPGGTTKTRAAQAAGKEGAALGEIVKTGQGVEIAYHEQGMHAATVRVLPSTPSANVPPDPAAQAHSARGVVSAVSGTSLSVKAAAGELTFVVDSKTTVVGTGVGTAARKVTEAGGKTAITEFVHAGDAVSVTYHDVAGAKHAASVHITKKG